MVDLPATFTCDKYNGTIILLTAGCWAVLVVVVSTTLWVLHISGPVVRLMSSETPIIQALFPLAASTGCSG